MTALEEMKGSVVVGFKNNSIGEYIETFLNIKGRKSLNTERSYRGYIRDFFNFACGKATTILTIEDVLNIKYHDIELFVKYLIKNKKYSNSTINTMIAALRSLFNQLTKNDNRISSSIFDVESLDEKPNGYDPLSEEECKNLFEYCLTFTYRNKGIVASMFFQTCFITALRKEAVLNMTWGNIKQREDINTNKMVWTIQVKDKGNKEDVIAISDKFYEKLIQLKNESTKQSSKVFEISDVTLYKMLNSFCTEFHINRKERNIGIHSIKKSSGDMGWKLTKDVKKVQKQLHHNSPVTTMNKYVMGERDLTNQISYIIDEELNMNVLDGYSKEELIEAIKKCGIGAIRNVLDKIGK